MSALVSALFFPLNPVFFAPFNRLAPVGIIEIRIPLILNPVRFLRLPTSFDIHDNDIMGDFIDTQSGARREKLVSAITGRSPFKNFKDEVRRMDIEKQWYDFQADSYKRKAIVWCEEHDLEWEE